MQLKRSWYGESPLVIGEVHLTHLQKKDFQYIDNGAVMVELQCWLVKETCLLLGGLSQWLTRIRDTRGWKYLHSRTSLTSSPLLRLTLGFNGRSTRYYAAAESTLAPTFLCLWYSLLRICHCVCQKVSICHILRSSLSNPNVADLTI